MTLQVNRKPIEWDEGEGEVAAIVLPGEPGAAPAAAVAEKPLIALSEDRAGTAPAASGARVIEQVARSFTAMTKSLRRGSAPAKKGELAAVERASERASESVLESALGAAESDTLVDETSGTDEPAEKAKAKPLRLTAPLLGGAALTALAISATALKLTVFSSAAPVLQSQEVGIEPNTPSLLAPSAQWALAPKREDVVKTAGKEAVQKHVDPLNEILSLKDPETTPGAAAGQSAKHEEAEAASKAAVATSPQPNKTSVAAVETPKGDNGDHKLPQISQAEKTQNTDADGHVLEAGEAGRAVSAREVHVAAVAPIAPAIVAAPTKPEREAGLTPAVSAPSIPHAPDKTENQVLAMVTELGSIVTKLKEEIAKTAAAEKKATEARDARLDDFERRILFSEAHTAVERAKFAGAAAAEVPTGSNPTQAQGLNPIKPMPAPGKAGKTSSKIASAGAAASEAAPQKRYRIQAASPGLAMLGEIDALESDAAPLQISVGSDIPGYGRVRSIDQRGAAWVVKTENGVIQ